MIPAVGYAAHTAREALRPFSFERRDPDAHDVLIDIHYCGVCHSDIHQARDEWGGAIFPMVPGHEIVGIVKKVGKAVTRFAVGDTVGVGCMVDSCRTCESCKEGLEQFCDTGASWTYNGTEQDKKTPTYGGYSDSIVVPQDFVLSVSRKIPLDRAAPLLCAGITTYSPLRHWKVGRGDKIAVVGLGGLGHMGVKLAAAMGAEVTVLSSTPKKKEDALRLGAASYAVTSNPDTFKQLAGQFHFILDTVSAPHDLSQYLQLLRRDGSMVLVGVPEKAEPLPAFPLILRRRSLAGSLIGGIRETQEMLDFCAEKGVASEVELIAMSQINEAYERMVRGDVRYRFVIDIKKGI